ncbi:MAG: tonB-denpendent receptor [Proteobacteria bacterium]|nr:tonB-denpendent receptor [Pseudomonadota bacterium]
MLVTATRSNKAVDETPVASYVVTAEQMEKRNIKSVDEAVSLVPGVFQRRGKGFMDTLNAITLRGVPDAKRSLIMVDGLSINDAYTGGADVGGFAPEDLERVEVVLGPGSSLYGSSAMGGVINFVSRMPKAEEYRFKLGYGNGLGTGRAPANLLRTYLSAGNAWQNGLSLQVSVAESQTDGYVTDEVRSTTAPPASVSGATRTATTAGATTYIIGDKGENAWRDSQIAIRAAFRIDADSALSASYKRTAYRYEYENYQSYLRNVAGDQVWTYTNGSTVREAAFLPGQGEMVRDISSLGLETRIGESKVKVLGGVIDIGTNWYTTVTSTLSTATASGGAAANGFSSTPLRSSQLEATVTTPLFGQHLLLWGASRREEKANTSEYDLGDWRNELSRTSKASESGGKAATTGLFAQAELALATSVRAYAGLRYDLWEATDGYSAKYGSGAFSRTYAGKTVEAVSPRLGATWSLSPQVLLRASLGKAFRAPNIYDLYRTWRSTAGTVFAGNPRLEPESLLGADIGSDLKPWPGADLKLTVYHNQFKDMIYRKTVKDNTEALSVCGQALNVAKDNCRVWDNAGRARSQGVELSLRQVLSSNWSAFGSLAYNDTKILENRLNPGAEGKKFPQVPQTTAALGAEWQHGTWSVSSTARYVAQRYSAEDNSDTVTGVPGAYDAYTLVDVRGVYRINSNFKLALSIDNLFDHEYYASYRAPGRAWFFELSGAF